ncbi:hypothetical protein KIW84_071489 [Lathyrus oleraceus]|uniref:RING-type E3 ubiquitin transferase n=1 Tax=Pisum sativum TaxID=3888 RepID=A0A9D4VJ64_PEA|nr:hypothetical protein KIW84_071489 [Pisum sativum]
MDDGNSLRLIRILHKHGHGSPNGVAAFMHIRQVCFGSATGLVALAEAGCTFPLPFAGFTWNVCGVLSLQTRSGMVLQSGCVVLRANLMLFYFEGLYYHISKRASATRYVFIGKASNQRSRYQILGVLLLIQLCVIAAEALRRWNKGLAA